MKFPAAILSIALSCPVFSQGQIPVLSNPSVCGLGLELDDNSCIPESLFAPNRFKIEVENAPGTALGVDVYLREVRLNIRHGWTDDLDISLISPSGREVAIVLDRGGEGDNFGLSIESFGCQFPAAFSMASCQVLDDKVDAPFVSGPYFPEESFFLFNDGTTDPNDEWTLQICDDAEEDAGILEYVELIFVPLTCLPVNKVEVLNIDATSVTLDWEITGNCEEDNLVLEYGPAGFTPGTGNGPGTGVIARPSCPPYTLNDLLPDTEYDFYLRRICGPGLSSGNSCLVSATTGCKPPEPLTLEGFEGDTLCEPTCDLNCVLNGVWRNDTQDDFDWRPWSGPTPTSNTGPSAAVEGNQYVYLESSGTTCEPDAITILESGCFVFNDGGSDECHFSFSYNMNGPNIGSLRLEATTDGGGSWDTLWERSGNKGPDWRKAYLDLDQYPNGDTLRFRFIAQKTRGTLGDIALDEIAVHGSTYLGHPSEVFYADTDGDGFGDPAASIQGCFQTPPQGFVRNADDCDDTNEFINPGEEEIACDGLDNNCNGINDDLVLPPPLAFGDTVCSGALAQLRAEPQSGGEIIWLLETEAGVEFQGMGEILNPQLPDLTGSQPEVHRFLAFELQAECQSGEPAIALAMVLPRPDAPAVVSTSICSGSPLDLRSLDIPDLKLTGAGLFFFENSIAPGNALDTSLVFPNSDTSFFFQYRTMDGCTDDGRIEVTAMEGPSFSFIPQDSFSLCLEGTQTLEASVVAGNPPYIYRWNTGAESASISIRAEPEAAGVQLFELTVADVNGCTSQDSAQVLTVAGIDSISRSIQDVSSCGGADGAITLTPLGGAGPFTYRWSSGNGTSGIAENIDQASYTISGLPQGAYRITITDTSSDRCEFQARTTYVNGPDGEVRDIEIQSTSCYSAADGSICLDIRGNPTYLWSTGDTTACLEGVPGGTYAVTITEGACNTILDSLLIPRPDSISAFFELVDPSCNGFSNGRIEIEAFGGTPPYTFSWNTGAEERTITGLAEGTYTITITDSKNCTFERTVTLIAPPPLMVALDSIKDMTCFGTDDGVLQVSGQGGTSPYLFQWEDGSPAPLRNGLKPGGYRLTVSDLNACTTDTSFLLTEPDSLTLQLVELTQPLCFGDQTGEIIVSASGGSPDYFFQWSNGAIDSVLSGVTSGSYAVQVRDANGCRSDSLSVDLASVSDPGLLFDLTPPDCKGRSDGAITILPLGTAPFQYLWNRGDTTATLLNVAIGTYSVQVIDSNGCIADSVVQVDASQAISAEFTAFTPLCAGNQDGSIQVSVIDPGTPPLAYLWNDGVTDRDRQGIGPGNYLLTITDSRGCLYEGDTVRLDSPDSLMVELAGKGDIICSGDSTGFIELQVKGGIAPYRFNWVGTTADTSSAFGLRAGTYRVFVEDENGCPQNAAYQITEPTPLDIEVIVQQSGDPCNGNAENSVQALVTGGVAPYQYVWSSGDTTAILNPADPGDYQLAIQDENSCREVMSGIKVRDAGVALTLDSFTANPVQCFGEQTGSLQVTIEGGQAPYRYIFSNGRIVNSNTTNVTLKNLGVGFYSVVVTDTRGCRLSSNTVQVTQPNLLSLRRDSIRDVVCSGTEEGAIFVSPQGGVKPYTFEWFESDSNQLIAVTEDLQNAAAGAYYCILTDDRNCVDSLQQTTIRNENPPLILVDTLIKDVRCAGASTGSISLELQGGRSPYQFLWNNGASTSNLVNIPASNYAVTVTDSDSCKTNFGGLLVDEPDDPLVINSLVRRIDCFGDSTGSIRIEIRGGTAPYRITWEDVNGAVVLDTTQLENLPAGWYPVQVIDKLDCDLAREIRVPQADSISVAYELVEPDSNIANGAILAQAQGGNPPFEYRWNTGDSTQLVSGLEEGTYYLSVTDDRLCIQMDSIELFITQVVETALVHQADIWPNPVFDRLNMELEMVQALPGLSLVWYELNGRLISRESLPQAASIRKTITIPPGKKGMKLLKLESPDGRSLAVWKVQIAR